LRNAGSAVAGGRSSTTSSRSTNDTCEGWFAIT
jgi:hypothetical protein